MKNNKCSAVDFIILSVALGANIIALFYQYCLNEMPCPLCLLQRVGLFFIALGAIMNLKFGKQFKYDFIIVISGIYNCFVATRQVLLHIMPNDPGYGSKFLNFHFYTWNDIISVLCIIFVTLSPIFKRVNLENILSKFSISLKVVINLFFTIFLILLMINAVSVYLECGFAQCPDNPSVYKY